MAHRIPTIIDNDVVLVLDEGSVKILKVGLFLPVNIINIK